MSKKIYLSGGLILVEEAGRDTETFNINSNDLVISGDQLSFYDAITKHAYLLGEYSDLIDENDQALASLSAAIVYIASLFPATPLESNGAVPVNIQDQTSEVVDLYMTKADVSLTLSSNTSIDDTDITVDDVTGVVVGDTICIKESGRYIQVTILTIVSTTLTIDSPLDFAYTTSADISNAEHDLSTFVASQASPVVFRVAPPPGVEWDIIRVLFHIEDNVVMDTAKFGGISALTNGIVLRASNGIRKNIFNIKTNGEFAEQSYDVSYTDKAPAGSYGITIRRTFGGQSKNGVVIRLDGDNGDELQLIIQDDLTALEHFHCIVQGHVVTD